MSLRVFLYILCAFATLPAFSRSIGTSVPEASRDSAGAVTDSLPQAVHLNLYQKIVRYFDESNKPPSDKKLDFSFIGGPYYSNETKFAIGLLGAGLYKSIPFDSLTPQSNATVYSQFSTTGYYLVGIKGDHIGPRDAYRVNYKVYFNSFPSRFWGIGYDEGHNDDNETKYLQLNAEVIAAMEFRLLDNLYLGPAFHFNYAKATDNSQWQLWDGEDLRTTNYGLGFNISYDTRDAITAPYSGWYASLKQRFYPRILKNSYCFSSTDMTVSHYFKSWRGAVVACRLHSLLTYGDTPWSMLATFGGSDAMRGYYEGRYRDKCEADITVELRQHVYRRNSVVAWIGAGTVFADFDKLRAKEILPNFGVGYRWEFKKRVNVRLDMGFGKGQSGFVFNINEAF